MSRSMSMCSQESHGVSPSLMLDPALTDMVALDTPHFPEFNEDMPEWWFSQLESYFPLIMVTKDNAKYFHVMCRLPKHVQSRAAYFLRHVPPTGKYNFIKKALLHLYVPSDNVRVDRILSLLDHELAGSDKKTPAEMTYEVEKLIPGQHSKCGHCGEPLPPCPLAVRILSHRFPPHVRSALPSKPQSWIEILEAVNKAWELHYSAGMPAPPVFTPRPPPSPSSSTASASSSAFKEEMDIALGETALASDEDIAIKIEDVNNLNEAGKAKNVVDVRRMNAQNDMKSMKVEEHLANRTGSKNRVVKSNGSKKPNPKAGYVCYQHLKFRSKAKKCNSRCSWNLINDDLSKEKV